MASKKINEFTGMTLVTSYFTILATNTIVLHFANIFFPKYMEFGTHELSYTFALFLSMGILALAGTFAIPFVRIYENMRSKMFGSKEWMGLYFLINTAGIWIIARFAFQLGFGISSWMVAVALGAVLDVAQGLAMMVLEKVRVK